MEDRICPSCERGTLRRSERRGLLERLILVHFGIYPWRCTYCRARLRISDRGPQREYVQGESRRRRSKKEA